MKRGSGIAGYGEKVVGNPAAPGAGSGDLDDPARDGVEFSLLAFTPVQRSQIVAGRASGGGNVIAPPLTNYNLVQFHTQLPLGIDGVPRRVQDARGEFLSKLTPSPGIPLYINECDKSQNVFSTYGGYDLLKRTYRKYDPSRWRLSFHFKVGTCTDDASDRFNNVPETVPSPVVEDRPDRSPEELEVRECRLFRMQSAYDIHSNLLADGRSYKSLDLAIVSERRIQERAPADYGPVQGAGPRLVALMERFPSSIPSLGGNPTIIYGTWALAPSRTPTFVRSNDIIHPTMSAFDPHYIPQSPQVPASVAFLTTCRCPDVGLPIEPDAAPTSSFPLPYSSYHPLAKTEHLLPYPPRSTVPMAQYQPFAVPSSPEGLDGPTATATPRSSMTFTNDGEEKAHTNHLVPDSLIPDVQLQETISREEEAMSRYGGDDIEDPPPKSPVTQGPALVAQPPKDPNMVDWDGPNDPANPQNWSRAYKWYLTMICILLSVNVTFASSAPASATARIIAEFGISKEVSYLVTSVFLIGYCFGPLFWGPGSELIGRRDIFIGSMFMYTIFHLGQALAQNIETLLVTRFISGFFACAPLTNSGGVIADIWDAENRGLAVSLFTASVFLGPVLGPIVAGFIAHSDVTWRWVFWVMMIFAGACTFTAFLLPETYAPVILARKAKKLRKAEPEKNKDIFAQHERQDWSAKGILHRTLFRPFSMLAMEPILVLVTLYLSLVYGLLYALFQAIPIVFVAVRGFTIAQDGLIFIGVGIGTTLGSMINAWLSRLYPSLIRKWKGFPPPEKRLHSAMIGSPVLVIGCFWLGWSGNYASVHWAAPAVATIVVGLGISLIFMGFLTYLVDTYLMYSASALAANTVVRSAVAAAFPLFTTQMFTNLGVNWACTLIGLLLTLFVPAPFLFYKYGPIIREKSKFAPCLDLMIAKQMTEEEKQTREKEKGIAA
ncbi:hypothetical protein NMY22_g6556 [Coprinellus aureogranulatus]|nr:hypothetical protein NMY22_g6556 [Coprinellus aureogranulatus]